MTRLLAVVAAAFVLLPRIAGAQEMPSLIGHFKPVVGSWAEYDLTHEGGKEDGVTHRLRVAVVEKEGDAFWVEMKVNAGANDPSAMRGMGPMIVKTLMAEGSMTPRRVLMKSARGVMEVAPRPSATPNPSELKEVGSETVAVPAGSFPTKVLSWDNDRGSGKTWIKHGIGPWSVVQSDSKTARGVSHLKLVAYGSDAKPEVDVSQAAPMMGNPMMGNSAMGADGAPAIPPNVQEMIEQARQRRLQQQQGGQ